MANHVILTGATGLVGGSVLLHILALPPSNAISRLSILSRSPVPLASNPNRTNTTTQIEVINHTDYNSYPPEVLSKLKGADAVIWAQGISQNEVDQATYVKITKDYPLAAFRAFGGLNEDKKLKFIHVSGEGATHSPTWYTPLFGRVKGETELALMALAKQPEFASTMSVYNVRPGGVDGRLQPEIFNKWVANRSAALRLTARAIVPALTAVSPSRMIPTTELGKVLTELAISDGKPMKGPDVENEGLLLRNKALRRLGGL